MFINLAIVFISCVLPSCINAVCWDTGCQLNSWAVKGCAQYNMRETGRRNCNGGVIYSCCDGQSSNVVNRQAPSVVNPAAPASNSCWDTGCQLSSWAVRGCEQYGRVATKTRSCSGGTIYTCCEPLKGGDTVRTRFVRSSTS